MDHKAHKTRYTDQELEEFKAIVLKKLDRAREEYDYFTRQLSEMADNEDSKIKGLDDGIGTAENERISTMASRQLKLINHLENALIRIENKAYGICRVTGKLISKQRLKAVPHATLSIDAKKQKKR